MEQKTEEGEGGPDSHSAPGKVSTNNQHQPPDMKVTTPPANPITSNPFSPVEGLDMTKETSHPCFTLFEMLTHGNYPHKKKWLFYIAKLSSSLICSHGKQKRFWYVEVECCHNKNRKHVTFALKLKDEQNLGGTGRQRQAIGSH